MELDIQHTTPELHNTLSSFVIEAGRQYNQKYAYPYADQPERTGQMMTMKVLIYFSGRIL